MRPLLALLLLTGISSPAFAGVGAQSSGVTSVDPNAPSTAVQQQSGEFLAQNQQAQNAAVNHGIAVPGTMPVTANNPSGGAAANSESAKEAAAHAEAAQKAAAAKPPPPPPVYESRIRSLARTTQVTETEAAMTVKPLPPKTPVAAPARKPLASPAQREAPQPTPAGNAAHANAGATPAATQAPELAPQPSGGRGAAPEGYTFYLGLAIAAALLALALATFLRIQRGEANS